jgi:glycerate-2-kinase
MGHRIQNFEALAENDLRTDALSIAEAGYAAIDVGDALMRTLRIENDELHLQDRVYPLAGRRIFFVGVGKCANAAAKTIEQLFGDRLTGGIAFDVSPLEETALQKIETHLGTHPLPSEENVRAAKRITEFLADRIESDLVIMLISGGGSALLCLPSASMTCTDEIALWNELTVHGASIQEINTVRKHISRVRGGGLAAVAYPAEVVSLIVSDVPGNDLGFIASGPTVTDATTVADAQNVLTRYHIASSANLEFLETPKEPKYFERVTNLLFLTNNDALTAMQHEAARRGYHSEVVDDRFAGEAREVGHAVVEKLHDAQTKTVLLYAGESTVTLGEHYGKGGRNQEMALAALNELHAGELILPFSSDGRDNTDCAGAIGDDLTRAHVFAHNLSIEEYLDAHKAYDFFAATGDALRTGYTGSNVSDLIIAMKQ